MTNTLAGKIAKASIEVGGFKADKTNKDQNYSYISADQVLSKAGDALARQGVMIIPQLAEPKIAVIERQGKSPRLDATVAFVMQLSDGETEMSVQWFGYGSDYMTPDKAVYKAITSGHKYFLMKLLNIGVGNEDGEHEMPPRADQGGPEFEAADNPDYPDDRIWRRWEALIARADAMKVPHGNPERDAITGQELRAAGKELLPIVEDAERQAATGTEAQS